MKEERDRKERLEQRGVAVVTSSGAIATLLFALAAAVTGAADFTLTEATRRRLAIAVTLFVAAAIFGLAANLPLRYREAQGAWLKKLTEPAHWDDTGSAGERRSYESRVQTIIAARKRNEVKGWLLFVAIALQVSATFSLGMAIYQILAET